MNEQNDTKRNIALNTPPFYSNNRNPEERDGCAVIAMINKNVKPTHSNVLRVIEGLHLMGHRSGEINGEGDGCGIMSDIPTEFWEAELEKSSLVSSLARDERFFIGHFFIDFRHRDEHKQIMREARTLFAKRNLDILCEKIEEVNRQELGAIAKETEPVFWQIAGYSRDYNAGNFEARLYALQQEIESNFPIHCCSLSSTQAIYKVRGTDLVLGNYFNDLKSEHFKSTMTVGHSRYSTNTFSAFERVQPFPCLAHNGEINTIKQLRREAQMLGISVGESGSDSQDLDASLRAFLLSFDLSLPAALEVLFPPIEREMKKMTKSMRPLYRYLRQFWGPFAQGPAAVIARFGNDIIGSVDAMGLRPLWLLESGDSYVLSSEAGVIPFQFLSGDPKPLGPGEKVMISKRGRHVKLLSHQQLQEEVAKSFYATRPDFNIQRHTPIDPINFTRNPRPKQKEISVDKERELCGWNKDDISAIHELSETGKEPVSSLGHGAPLACLNNELPNIADFFKENVAVVTNPAVDREREKEHFSTRVILGRRSSMRSVRAESKIEIKVPFVLVAEGNTFLDDATLNSIALNTRSICWRSMISQKNLFHGIQQIDTSFGEDESLENRLKAIAEEAVDGVRERKELIILNDSAGSEKGRYPIDPALVTVIVDKALRKAIDKGKKVSLRRHSSIIVKSNAIRNLHDIAVMIGLGATAIAPEMMIKTAIENAENREDAIARLTRLINGLTIGLEKVISTMGIHELRGYHKLFASIGFSYNLAEIFEVRNFCGGESQGVSIEKIEYGIRQRKEKLKGKLTREGQINARIWKKVGQAARDEIAFKELEEHIAALEEKTPLSIRHCFDIKPVSKQNLPPEEVDLSVDTENLPFLISAMSYGSQNERAFYAYAEAAKKLKILALNGEGGEPESMLGKYYNFRSQQIASGRFGINVRLLNSSKYLEIKVGQGAKPGEGGMLPAQKVTTAIAQARHAREGVALISPSNNHDIYSIEDLAQMISELKIANENAKVIVKIPVVEGVGTIALAVVKAGADVVNISGFDGGTGAARSHAIKHVGLPVEIGVYHAHSVLTEEGIRDCVEIWADGGIRRAADVLKMIALGANRVGFGTLPMMALGCTSCKGCHLNTCHVGIATQIATESEAKKKGLKAFRPVDKKAGTKHLINLFQGMAKELRELCAKRGIKKLQDIVGNTDLLHQFTKQDAIDIEGNITSVSEKERSIRRLKESRLIKLRRPQNQLTKDITSLFAPHLKKKSKRIILEETKCNSSDRALVTDLAGHITREQQLKQLSEAPHCTLFFKGALVAGGGFAAYHREGLTTIIEGSAQDGACKSAQGGDVYILKGLTASGKRVGGSVGKCFAYGAQKGFFIVQGDADSRACIRMSGANVVFSAPMKIDHPISPNGHDLDNANLKGFAFEYMTDGHAVVLGDPGVWICGGMTGGAVYVMLQPAMGLTKEVLETRLSESSVATVQALEGDDEAELSALLSRYRNVVKQHNQFNEVKRIESILSYSLKSNFIKIAP